MSPRRSLPLTNTTFSGILCLDYSITNPEEDKMKASELLELSEEELERLRDKKTMPLGIYDHYVEGLKFFAKNMGITLEKAIELTFASNDEHSVHYIMAYQHLRGKR